MSARGPPSPEASETAKFWPDVESSLRTCTSGPGSSLWVPREDVARSPDPPPFPPPAPASAGGRWWLAQAKRLAARRASTNGWCFMKPPSLPPHPIPPHVGGGERYSSGGLRYSFIDPPPCPSPRRGRGALLLGWAPLFIHRPPTLSLPT